MRQRLLRIGLFTVACHGVHVFTDGQPKVRATPANAPPPRARWTRQASRGASFSPVPACRACGLPPSLRLLDAPSLPPLPEIGLRLYRAAPHLSPPAQHVHDIVLQALL
ncbi:hypothetical protein GTP55_08525 [Duganella sp. FT109W]|uniref:DUF2946 domain-containing protein n=1 Tax=Duganella margarita TaxID=2692170 RepID=A0ABW9WG72_9BURK|nr:hypothetical protein [Duganella margarita]